ncbi:TRAP transporter permease [Saccharospirillum sp.]|uniref:TRAP transporter permease n=1 Tax=Saccharospirillum sp. TaxID=2033801 RepID=UPI0034A08E4E
MTTEKNTPESTEVESIEDVVVAAGVDDEPIEPNRRQFTGPMLWLIMALSILYSGFHLYTLNIAPLETWAFRILHVCGASILGFILFSGARFTDDEKGGQSAPWTTWAGVVLLVPALYVLVQTAIMQNLLSGGALRLPVEMEVWHFGWPLLTVTGLGIVLSWLHRRDRGVFSIPDLVLVVCSMAVASYLVIVFNTSIRMSTGTSFAPVGISFAAVAGTALIFELTRRLAGYALVVISLVFLGYVFIGPYLPGFLGYPGLSVQRFFSQVYTDAGVLGPTTAVSSTYIILFIIFAAFLQASKVGDYFVNFAFALAGRSRGGPAKVAIFASGLMGMINGTSAGNVVSTGSLTIPLMKKVGYNKTSAGAVEAAASTGGQIMPPIMGAGAFIMAEITGIPYTEIAIAAIIPAILYFASVYFMVDLEAARTGMRGMRDDELPSLRRMVRQVYLFIPIIILIGALFMGYSVIRAGTLATVSAAVVSWISPNKMGIKAILKALEIAAYMSIQIIVVCACAGIIVAVISLTGVGARFSSLLLGVAEASQLLALFFAMCISILLGMGMPTTAAYAVAASVVAPGLVQMGIPVLTAHFFVFYFAVVSAITPPVALASYAAAAISGAKAMATSVASFKMGLAAFIVPFMFFYNSALLMDAEPLAIIRALITAVVGVYLLSSGVQAWFLRYAAPWYLRILLIVAAFLMIEGGIYTDLVGVAAGAIAFFVQRVINGRLAQAPS